MDVNREDDVSGDDDALVVANRILAQARLAFKVKSAETDGTGITLDAEEVKTLIYVLRLLATL